MHLKYIPHCFYADCLLGYQHNRRRWIVRDLCFSAKMSQTTRVLYIAAHPDDENTRLLTFLSRKHFETTYLSLTRGDGGQNLIGDEQGADLGMGTHQELLAARQVDGTKQFFTRP